MTAKDAREAIAKHGSQREAAKALGCSRKTLAKALGTSPSGGRSLNDFAATYDKDTIIPAKINAALADLGDGWEYESEFVRRAGVSFADLGNYRDNFTNNWMKIRQDDKRAWSGSPATVRAMREMAA